MSDSQPAATTGSTTADLGVVDPIRIPGAARAHGLWSGLPGLGQVFVALVAVDIVIRALGLFRTSLFIDLSAPLTWITAFLPHDALILLPAVILARRPTALAAVPLVLRGAVAVALVELLKDPIRGLLGGVNGDNLVLLELVAMASAWAIALGWVAIGRGLQAFSPAKPWDSSALLANIVGGALALVAIAAAGSWFVSDLDLGDQLETLLVKATGIVAALSGLGLAYLAWVIVRGTDDPARPAAATRLASVSVAGIALGTVLSLVAGAGVIWLLIFFVAWVGGYTGLVVAFGLGLADPSGTIDRAVPTDDPAPELPEPA
jgi:hypothetical protein